jgi:acyl-[acyl-carrier-protein] desaturase
MYRAYLDFFEAGERKRRWSVFDDIPWTKLDPSRNSERKALCIETFCAEECYLPDYSANGLQLARSMFGAAWFQACWSYEESKHGLVFREYLRRSGMRSETDLAGLEDRLCAERWQLPFDTSRKMAIYGALQEAATWLAYRAQRDRAEMEGDEVLEAIFAYVSRDEGAHADFYRTVIAIELTEERTSTLADFAYVLSRFKMPGDGLIPDYQQRLKSSGAGISSRIFFTRAVMPLIKMLGSNRDELKLLRPESVASPHDGRRKLDR